MKKNAMFFPVFLISSALAFSLAFSGCGGGSSSGGGSDPGILLLRSISISGPSSALQAGQSTQCSAVGTYSDGSTSDIASSVSWSSSNPSVATVDSTGKVTGAGAGTTQVTAAKDGITSNSLSITVSEKWTFKGYTVGKNPGNETGGAGMAEVIRLASGTYRMYYGTTLPGNLTGIKYAESADGITWTVKGTVLQGPSSLSDPEYLISAPSVLSLANGKYRMYYQSAPQAQPGQTHKYHVRSAISDDGVSFTRETGTRINITTYDAASTLSLAGHGTYFYTGDGTTIVGIFSGELASDMPGPSNLMMATSSDGMTFGSITKLYSLWHDPIVIKTSGGYRMYATYLLQKQGTAFSADGINWPASMTDVTFVDSGGSTLTEGNSGVGDISGVLLPSGQVRLYTNYGSQLASDDIVYFEW